MSISFIGRNKSTINITIASIIVKKIAQSPTIYPQDRPDFILTSILGSFYAETKS
jgi:hypothetical protein